ncbi:MAG: hypothetical protein ACNA7J_02545 [Wenzhouxiangella sp.]
MATIISMDGTQQEVKLEPTIYKEAVNMGLTVPQLVNRRFPTPKGNASSFDQLCASSGLIVKGDREMGIRAPTLAALLDGRATISGASNVLDADPASRILYPAVVLEMIEDALVPDRESDVREFDRMVANDVSISQARFEWPVISLKRAEAARSRAITQLTEPQMMLTITSSDKSRSLLATSIGLEVSDQALAATTLDFVSMAVRRQAEVERNLMTYEYLLAFLQGDTDMDQDALDQTKADTYDSAIVAAGAVTKKALIKWLVNNYYLRRIDWVVTDLNGALAIEKALENTNTNQHVFGSLVPSFSLVNRALSNLNLFIVEDNRSWPANTVMGLDSRYAIQRVRNSAAAYSAVESFVMRRSTQLRFDSAEICYRLWDDAFDTLSLTLSDT